MHDEATIKALEEALRRVFGEGQERQRFIDVSRIPLICQSILNIESDLKDMKGNLVTRAEFSPVQKIVFGLVALILVAVVGALLSTVIIK